MWAARNSRILRQLVASVPGLDYSTAKQHGNGVRLYLNGRCASVVERMWPLVHTFCRNHMYSAHFYWETGLVSKNVRDTASATPIIETEDWNRATLTLLPLTLSLRKVA